LFFSLTFIISFLANVGNDASCVIIEHNDHNYSLKLDGLEDNKNKLPCIKQRKKRGKFLQPCPDITIIHQKPTANRTSGIIQNGNKLAPVKIFNKKVSFRNTCAFDSIIEILASSYCNFQKFKTFVDVATKSNENSILKIVLNYARAGVSKSLYRQRANLLYAYIHRNQDDSNEISCVINVCRLFEEMMENYPSLIEKIYCNKCEYNTEKIRQTISVQTQPILKQGIQCLQDCIQKVVQDQIIYCKHCQEKCAISKKIFSSYVCIDIEYVYQSMLQRAYKFSGNITSNIRDIPIYLLINNVRYVLSGVVQFIEPEIQEGLGHYIAYCRSLNNNWEKRDDMHKKTEYMGQNKLNMKIAFIFYVQCPT